MDINFIENMPSDNDMATQRRARQQEVAERHPDYSDEQHAADNRELTERFANQRSTRELAIDQIAGLL